MKKLLIFQFNLKTVVILVCISLLGFPFHSSSQSTFEIRFPKIGKQKVSDLAEDEAGVVYATALNECPNGLNQGRLLRITPSGDTTSVVLHDSTYNLDYQSLIVGVTGEIIVAGVKYPKENSPDSSWITVSVFSPSMQLMWSIQKALPANHKYIMTQCMQYLQDGNYILGGSVMAGIPASPSNEDVFLAALNLQKKQLDFHFYPMQGNQYLFDMHYEQDSALLKFSAQGFSLNSATQIISVDTSYSIRRIVNLKYGIRSPAQFKLMQGHTMPVFSVTHNVSAGSFDSRMSLMRLNNAMEVVSGMHWDKPFTYEMPAVHGGLVTGENGSLVVAGNCNTMYPYSASWFLLSKVDSVCNVLWARYFGGDGFYTMLKMIATRDGGFLMAGYYADTLTPDIQGMYLLKVNSNGLISNTDQLQADHSMISLFPNPVSDMLWIKSALPYPVNLELIDITGQVVREQLVAKGQNCITLTGLSKGIYMARCRIGGEVQYCSKIIINQ